MFVSIQLVHFEVQWRKFGKPTHLLKRASVCPLCSVCCRSRLQIEVLLLVESAISVKLLKALAGWLVPACGW